jgi:3-deoxy-7-phosphoheptulonate synthase
MKTWSPHSWRSLRTAHQPVYSSRIKLLQTTAKISSLPPLVSPGEVDNLKCQIAEAAAGRKFILQGGDCAETFENCKPSLIMNQLKILLQMSVVLTYGARKPVIRIGRMAGQYAKPRSRSLENIRGTQIPAYMGDAVNSFEPIELNRRPDPERLLSAFQHSCLTLNYIRSMIDGGFADLHKPHTWDLFSIRNSKRWDEYGKITAGILDAIDFMESFGGLRNEALGRVDFFISHEGLLLEYESALTHRAQNGKFYNLGAHMLWIGNRTRDLHSGHVEYFRGIENPIGIKIGPDADPAEISRLITILDPRKEPGRITLITRLGRDKVRTKLPGLIKAVAGTGSHPVWSCDPMHGNTFTTGEGVKTRRFDHVLEEMATSFQVHKRHDSRLSGVHFELTGENVTECTGGAIKLKNRDLGRNYATFCDPRLNYQQSMEMAFLITLLLKEPRERS